MMRRCRSQSTAIGFGVGTSSFVEKNSRAAHSAANPSVSRSLARGARGRFKNARPPGAVDSTTACRRPDAGSAATSCWGAPHAADSIRSTAALSSLESTASSTWLTAQFYNNDTERRRDG